MSTQLFPLPTQCMKTSFWLFPLECFSTDILLEYSSCVQNIRYIDHDVSCFHSTCMLAWWAVRLYSCILHRLHEAVYCKGKFALDYSIHWSSDELHQMKYVHHIQTWTLLNQGIYFLWSNLSTLPFFMHFATNLFTDDELGGFLPLIHLFNIPSWHPGPLSPIDQHQQAGWD